MTLPLDQVKASDINTEIGAVAGTQLTLTWVRSKTKGAGTGQFSMGQLKGKTYYQKNTEGNCNNGNCYNNCNCGTLTCTNCVISGTINCLNCDTEKLFQDNCNCATAQFNCTTAQVTYNCNCGTNCGNCTNCADCTDCGGYDCANCSDCANCADCASDCGDCGDCSD